MGGRHQNTHLFMSGWATGPAAVASALFSDPPVVEDALEPGLPAQSLAEEDLLSAPGVLAPTCPMAISKGFPGDFGVLAPAVKEAKAPEPRPKAAAPGDEAAAPPPGVVAVFERAVARSLPDRLFKDVLRLGPSPAPLGGLFVERESLVLLQRRGGGRQQRSGQGGCRARASLRMGGRRT